MHRRRRPHSQRSPDSADHLWRLWRSLASGRRISYRQLLLLAGAALLLYFFTPLAQQEPARAESGAGAAPGQVCTIASISDGDTVTCEGGERVRLLLIDTPEMSQEPYGAQAKAALERLLPVGSRTRLEPDVQERDRYGRVLAYVYTPDGRMANEEMARQGYAVSLTYPPNVKHIERIRAAVEEARVAKRGLWSTSAFECSPRDFRAGRCS